MGCSPTSFIRPLRCLAAMLAIVIVMGSGAALAQIAQQTVKIGVILPLTGPAASLGALAREGVLAATKYFNDGGGVRSMNGAKLEPLIRDHAGRPDVARAVAQSLIEDEKVAAILGFQTSDVSIVGSQACALSGVPCISVDATTVMTERGQGNVYRVFPSIAQYGLALVDEFAATGAGPGSKVAILTVQGSLGQAASAAIRAAAEKRGWNVVAASDYPGATTRDFVPIVTGLKNSGAQAVFALCYGEAPQIMEALKQAAYRPEVYGVSAGFAGSSFIATLKADANYVYVSAGFSPDLAAKSPSLMSLVTQYAAAHDGAYPGVDFFQYLTLIAVMKEALEESGSTEKPNLKTALHSLHMKFGDPLVATLGGVQFSEQGDNIALTTPVLQIQDMKQAIVSPENVATAKPLKTPPSW